MVDDSSDGLFAAAETSRDYTASSRRSPTPVVEPHPGTTHPPCDDGAPPCRRIYGAGAAMNNGIAGLPNEKNSPSPNNSSAELTWPASELCLGENEAQDSRLPQKSPSSPLPKAPETCGSRTYNRQSTSQTSHVAAEAAALGGCCACNCHGMAQKKHSPDCEEPPTPISSPDPSMQAVYREEDGISGSLGRYQPLVNRTMTPNVQMNTASDRRVREKMTMDKAGPCDINPASISDRRCNLDAPKPTETGQHVGLHTNSQRWSGQIPARDTAPTREPPDVSHNESIRETRRKVAATARAQSLNERRDAPSARPVVDNCILEVASVSYPGRLELWGNAAPSGVVSIPPHDVAGPALANRAQTGSALGPVHDRESLGREEASREESLESQAAAGEQGSPSMSDLLPSDLSLLLAEDLADEGDPREPALQSEDNAPSMGGRGYPHPKARGLGSPGEVIHGLPTHHFAVSAQREKSPTRATANLISDRTAPDELLVGFWRRRTRH